MRRLTPLQWTICAVAALGFLFDTYELLMLPLIVRPALMELAGLRPGTPEFNLWTGLLFNIPAIAGGIFGLLGGYLCDLFGRRRVLVWSILLYAFSAFAAGFATSLGWLLFFRCTTFVGVCVEFVAAVAWLAELFDDRDQREAVIGWTQAFGSVGGLMVTAVYYFSVNNADSFPAIHGGQEAWRYTLISGVIPAIPLIIIRPFLPESRLWQERKTAGTLKRPSIAAIFAPEYRRTTIVTTIMFACAYGAAYGAIQHVPRIAPGLPEVRELARPLVEKAASSAQFFQEMGGLAGRLLLALLAVRVLSRRRLLHIFQLPGLFVVPVVFFLFAGDLGTLKIGIFLVALCTVAQFSFWGNYLPLAYPTHLRGTGESFAANIGGRMIGTSFALATTTLANHTPGAYPAAKLAFAAGIVGTFVYVIGVIASRWLPEPAQEKLPE